MPDTIGRLISRLMAEDKEMIAYRPKLNRITGSVLASVLLQQANHRFVNNDEQPFYKFRAPCKHALYHEGDSWTEELGFPGDEFDSALKRIGTKIVAGASKAEALKKTDPTGLVLYWTDSNRVTWYLVNVELLGNLAFPNYLEKGESPSTLKSDKVELPLLQRLPKRSTKPRRSSAGAGGGGAESLGEFSEPRAVRKF